jgi:hypothetical protein
MLCPRSILMVYILIRCVEYDVCQKHAAKSDLEAGACGKSSNGDIVF